MYRLFNEFASRYDMHTPPEHYRHDHAFVLEWAQALGPPGRVLDVGCGTGVFLEKARQAGWEVRGLDASPGMVQQAEQRLGPGVVELKRMQELDEGPTYHAIVSLSWTLNYCASRAELLEVLRRFHSALLPGGGVVLQVAHAAHAPAEVLEDREAGPGGEPEDLLFLYRFRRVAGEPEAMEAEYVYACKSLGELLHERHLLRVADAHVVAECVRETGFVEVKLYDTWRKEPFASAVSPFVVAHKPG